MPDLVQPLAEALVNPPTYLLKPTLQPEILSGEGNLPRWNLSQTALTYGVLFTVLTVPPFLGKSAGSVPVYTLPLITITLIQTLQTGFELVADQFPQHLENQAHLFNNLVYPRVFYSILPGVEFTFSYLVAGTR